MLPCSPQYQARFALTTLLVLLALSAALLPQPSAQGATLAATRKLSAIATVDGTVRDSRIVAGRIIYLADNDIATRFDLYSAPLTGGEPVRLTAGLPNGSVEQYDVSPGGLIVFSFLRSIGGLRFVYSVPATGGTPTLLGPEYADPPPVQVGTALDFALTNTRVIFRVDVQRTNAFELFSVPATGGQVTRISQALPDATTPLTTPSWVTSFAVNTGGTLAAYRLDGNAFAQATSLYAVPVTGGTPTLLGANPNAGSGAFSIAPDGARIAYVRGSELYTVASDGTGTTLIDTSSSPTIPLAITPNSATLVYMLAGSPATLKSVPLAGAGTTVLSTNARFTGPDSFKFTPDGTQVIFNNNAGTSLLLTPVGASSVQTMLSGSATAALVSFTNNGSTALFASGQALYSYPLATGPAQRIDDPAASAGGFLAFDGVSTGSTALYAASTSASAGVFRLYSVPITGGASTPLTDNLGTRQELIFVRAAADNTAIFTSGTSGGTGPQRWRRLYAVAIDGSSAARLLDTPRALVGDVSAFDASTIDQRAVYLADQEIDGVVELFSTPLAGGAFTRLNSVGQTVLSFEISPAGGTVVFVAREGDNELLVSAPIAGGPQSPIVLPQGFKVAEYSFTPDGSQVVFTQLQGAVPLGLYRAPATGGPATLIDPNGDAFNLSSDSASVTYSAAGSAKSAPLAGGDPVVLGSGIVERTAPRITPDGTRAVFVSIQGQFDPISTLFVIPIGGGRPVDLFTSPGIFGINDFTPDSSRVVFTIYQNNPARGEVVETLASIALSGGVPTTLIQLNGDPFFPPGNFRPAMSPKGDRIVTSVRTPSTLFDLKLVSIALTGGISSTIYMSNTIGIGELPFEISPDGEELLFRGGFDLYRTPAAGGAVPERISLGQVVPQFTYAVDGSTIFVESGVLFQAARGGPAAAVSSLPDGSGALNFIEAEQTVLFNASRDGTATPGSGVVELYSSDLNLAPPSAGFTTSALNVREDVANPNVSARLNRPATSPVTAAFSVTGGTAVAGVDYTLGTGPLVFATGERVKPLPLTILDRPRFNGVRTIVITLGATAPAEVQPAQLGTLTITITDKEVGVFIPFVKK